MFSQDVNKTKENIYDNIVGLENTGLFNGKRYYNAYKATPDNNNFFFSPYFVKGVVVYDNQVYTHIDMSTKRIHHLYLRY